MVYKKLMNIRKKLAIGGVAVALGLFGAVTTAPAASAEPSCAAAGAYGSCDMNDYAPDGSHTHCDTGWAPFVGQIRNCYWVNTRP